MNEQQVHFILQGKGGVGKSFISAILVQYFQARESGVQAYDTDPVNDTLSQYQQLGSRRVQIIDQGNRINARTFDGLIEDIIEAKTVCVIDNGASTFVPLMAYMIENRVMELMARCQKQVFIHSVVTGGQAFNDTLQGLSVMLQQQSAPIIVWLNEFFGAIENAGKSFEESALYSNHRERIHAVLRIERGNPDTFGRDMEMLGKNKLTFEQAQSSPLFGIMSRQRLKMVQEALYSQLEQTGI